jgi:hypothetical protein
MTLDTETYNGLLGGLKRIAVYDGTEVTYGYSYEDVEAKIEEWKKNGYVVHVYIHNMEFDLRKLPIIFQRPKYIEWEKSFVINGKLAKVQTSNCAFHDSFKILPMSLKKASQDFEVEHGKLDLWEEVQETYPNEYSDIVDFLDRCHIDDELYLKYLGYDVISLYEVIYKLIEISGLSESDFVGRLSTASLSRFIFKKGYKGYVFKSGNNPRSDYKNMTSFNYNKNLEIEDFLRMSYCGGRTEVFKIKLDNHGYHYDVNSLYPFVMAYNWRNRKLKAEYPIGKPIYIERGEVAKHYFEEWTDDHRGLGFINAKVFIPKQHIPPLPVKMGKLTFPCGEVVGTWTYEELEYAIKECGVEIREYYAVCHYSQTYPVFYDFISVFSKMKEQASKDKNESLRTFSKLLQNVGYGYTGMRRDDKSSLLPYHEIENHPDFIFADKNRGFIEIPTEIKAEYIQVQIASYVTSRARLVLLDALRKADEKGEVYYCDTDSLVTDKPLPKEIVHKDKLGMWKLEGEPLKALFLKPKVYAEIEEDKTIKKFKGVSRSTQEDFEFATYQILLKELQTSEKEFVIVEKNKTMFRSIMYMNKNEIDFDYFETRDKKFNLQNVDKRTMDYKNNQTYPLYFETEDEFFNFHFTETQPIVNFYGE